MFVYDKIDDQQNRTSRLAIQHTIFVEQKKTADFQTTRGIIRILNENGNLDDIMAFMQDRNLPIDDIEANAIAEAIMQTPPQQGYLTISNALQWRLQYGHVIREAGNVDGIYRIR